MQYMYSRYFYGSKWYKRLIIHIMDCPVALDMRVQQWNLRLELLDCLYRSFVCSGECLCRTSHTLWINRNIVHWCATDSLGKDSTGFEFRVSPSLRPVALLRLESPVFPTIYLLIVEFMPFPRALEWSDIQTDLNKYINCNIILVGCLGFMAYQAFWVI